MRLVDSHAHLNADRFDDDVDAILEVAREAGIERLLVPGWNVRSSDRAVELGEAHPWLDVAIGIHPHDAGKTDEAGWGRIVELASHPSVVAIGETGLDFDRNFSPVEDQLRNLRRNLALALETGKPAVLHCRSAAGRSDAQAALHRELLAAGFGGAAAEAAFGTRPPAVLHSFSGSVEYAVAMLDLGCAVSFSGLVFRRGEEASAEVARIVPAERLLVETDAPFLSPPGGPRGRNEPPWVRITAAWVAEQRGDDPDALGDGLIRAYERLFGSRRPV